MSERGKNRQDQINSAESRNFTSRRYYTEKIQKCDKPASRKDRLM